MTLKSKGVTLQLVKAAGVPYKARKQDLDDVEMFGLSPWPLTPSKVQLDDWVYEANNSDGHKIGIIWVRFPNAHRMDVAVFNARNDSVLPQDPSTSSVGWTQSRTLSAAFKATDLDVQDLLDECLFSASIHQHLLNAPAEFGLT